jgi:TonB family protein
MSLVIWSVVKVSLVVLTGLVATFLLRRRSAAVRHWVLAAAIFCAASVPVLELVVPARVVHVPAFGRSVAIAPRATEAKSGDAAVANEMTVVVSGQPPATNGASRTIADLMIPAWAAGAVLSLAVLAIGLVRLWWLASRARPLEPGTWTRLAEEIGREYGLRRPVRLLESDHPSLLVTWGLLQPKVLVPRAARTWSNDRIAIVLGHELAHVRRGDWIVQIAGELLRSAFWFNPLLWLACMRLRQESEQACDDEVLARGVEGQEYATHLLALARVLKAENAPSLPAPAVARPTSLERRIRAMLDARLIRTPATRSLRAMTGAALVLTTIGVAAAQTGPVRLTGSVVDSSGAPVPGTTIVLTNTRTGAKHEVKSNNVGVYEFVPLPADDYTLETRLPGFAKDAVPVKLSGKEVHHDVKLRLGELVESINVRGGAQNGAATTAAATKVQGSVDRSAFERELASCKVTPVGGNIRAPRKILDVKPVYPPALQESGVGGKVVMKATIGTDGTVRDVEVTQSANPDLDNAAVEAVRQWRFDGTLLNCVPSDVTMTVNVEFKAQ